MFEQGISPVEEVAAALEEAHTTTPAEKEAHTTTPAEEHEQPFTTPVEKEGAPSTPAEKDPVEDVPPPIVEAEVRDSHCRCCESGHAGSVEEGEKEKKLEEKEEGEVGFGRDVEWEEGHKVEVVPLNVGMGGSQRKIGTDAKLTNDLIEAVESKKVKFAASGA